MKHYLFGTTICTLGLVFVVMAADPDECSCSCVKAEIPTSIVEQEELLEQEKEKIKEELYVNKESLSASVRKKSSADDERPSAQNVGYMGVAMLGLAGGLIIVMDVNYIIQIAYSVYSKLPCFYSPRSK